MYATLEDSQTQHRMPGWLPWLVACALGSVFLATEHSLDVSQTESFTQTPEQMEAAASGGNSRRRIAFLTIGLLGFCGIVFGRKPDFRFVSLLGGLMFAYAAWCGLSMFWSDSPSMTMRRVILLGCFFTGAVGLARQIEFQTLMKVVVGVCLVFLSIGLCTELSVGTFRPWASGYRFSGTLHPNTQGLTMATMCLAAICLFRSEKRWKPFYLTVFFIGLVAIILTKSRTSAAGVLLAVAPLWVLKSSFRFRFLAGFGGVWCVCAGLLVFLLSGIDYERDVKGVVLLGRSEKAGSLTGRVPIWTELAPHIAARPLMGYGYDSFWTPERIETISTTLGWGLREAHSSYIETVLSVGLIGATLLLSIVALGMLLAAIRYATLGDASYGFLFGLFTFGAVNAFTESGMAMPLFVPFIATAGLAHLAFCRPTQRSSSSTAVELRGEHEIAPATYFPWTSPQPHSTA